MLALVDTDDLKTVRELERLRIEATRRNDADVLAPLLDEQLIYINSAGAVFDKEHYLKGIRTHSLTGDRDFDVLETEVQALDDVIILVGIMLGPSGRNGERPVFHFPCIGVWRKHSGRWRMLAWQSPSGSTASWTRSGRTDQSAGTPRPCFASNGGQGRAIARRDLLRRMK